MLPEQTNLFTLLALLLLGGLFAGRAAPRFGLPAMTGHLLAGAVIGAACSPLVSASADFLATAKQGLASVLLFWIGTQLNVERLRLHKRTVASFSGAMAVSVLFCGLAIAFPLPYLFDSTALRALTWVDILVAALVLSATSPTVIAVVTQEYGREGQFARTALDAALVANVGIVLFIIGIYVVGGGIGTPGKEVSLALIRDVSAGLAVGGAVGVFAGFGSHAIPASLRVAVAALAFLVLRQQLVHFEVASMAGFLFAGMILSGTREQPAVLGKLAKAVPIVSTILFVIAGALADLELVVAMAVPALLTFLVRAFSLWLGARIAGTMSKDMLVKRLGFAPLLPQAGFSIAIVGALDASNHSTVLISLIVAVVLINEVAMPPVLRLALRASEKYATPLA